MSVIKTGTKAHDDAVNAAESVHQQSLAAATTQAAAKTADVTFYRAARASAIANNGGAGIDPFIRALQELGTGGT